jgi:hypothetical protein
LNINALSHAVKTTWNIRGICLGDERVKVNTKNVEVKEKLIIL